MPPEAISLGLFILQEAIKDAPEIAAELQKLFSKADPTPDDWTALRAKVASKKYSDYAPDPQPQTQTTTP